MLTELDRDAEALESFRRGLAIRERLAREAPSVTEYQSDLAHGLNGTGYMLDVLGQKAEAMELHRRALLIRERLVAANPTVTEHRNDLARSLINIGGLLRETGHLAEALTAYGRARATVEQLVREHPAAPTYRFALGAAMHEMAVIEMEMGHWHQAREWLVQAIACHRQAVAAMPDYPKYLGNLRRALGDLIRVYSALDQPAEAIGAARERASIARGESVELYNIACDLSLGVPLAPQGRRRDLADEAMRTLRRAIAAGWNDATLTGRDPDLNPLRRREDFRRLLDELFDRAFPDDPFAP